MQEIMQVWTKKEKKIITDKVETVKQRKNKTNHRDEKKNVRELSVKIGIDSKTLKEESSLKKTVGLKRVGEKKKVTYQGSIKIM